MVPLVTFIPLRRLRETPETALPLTASLIVPEIVPAEQVFAIRVNVATTSVWLSVARVADWLASLKPLLMYVKVYMPKLSEDLLKSPLLSVVELSTIDPYKEKLTLTPDKALPLSCLTLPLIVPEPDGVVVNPSDK